MATISILVAREGARLSVIGEPTHDARKVRDEFLRIAAAKGKIEDRQLHSIEIINSGAGRVRRKAFHHLEPEPERKPKPQKEKK